ncbi:hypothetical protein [uncultured Shewanella sp.]|uniref:hypothetical protein n=1 Tax=uncultured Shewanella sp. TaxID=173975 RepID=UPI0026169F38|nr:hypothetical protein [uncultured Shewanella sp.]
MSQTTNTTHGNTTDGNTNKPAFIFTPKRHVKQWPAVIKIAGDGGQVIEHEIYLDLVLLPNDEYIKTMQQGDAAVFDRIMTGFSGIQAADGSPLTDTPDNRAALYQHVPFTEALVTAYRQANSGEAARKNS